MNAIVMHLTINNSCLPKKNKKPFDPKNDIIPKHSKNGNLKVNISSISDQTPTEIAKKDESPQLFEEIENKILNISEKVAPIVQSEDWNEFELIDNSFEMTLLNKEMKTNYVQSKVKWNNFGVKWSILTEVVNSGIKEKISIHERIVQEAMFEVIASEARYYSGLDILVNHYSKSYLFTPLNDKLGYVNPIDKHHVFSNISDILETSRRLLYDLEVRWLRDKPLLKDVCDIIYNHATGDSFKHYVVYIRNQNFQMEALQNLMECDLIKKELIRLESFEASKNLPLNSYLLLPLQRLTRLKLLCANILKVLQKEELNEFTYANQIQMAKMAKNQIEKLLSLCQSGKCEMNKNQLLLDLIHKTDFPKDCKIIDLKEKRLLKEGEFQINSLKNKTKSKKKKKSYILFLFNDIMMVGERNGSRIQILDYCSRKDVILTEKKSKINSNKTSLIINESEEDRNYKFKFYLKFNNSCSGVCSDTITLISPKRDVIEDWMTYLQGSSDASNYNNLKQINQPSWQSIRQSTVQLNT